MKDTLSVVCVYTDVSLLFFGRFGYFGRDKPAVFRLLLCSVSGCLTDGQVYMSVSGEELVSTNAQDLNAIRLLQSENIEVWLTCSYVVSEYRPLFLIYSMFLVLVSWSVWFCMSGDPDLLQQWPGVWGSVWKACSACRMCSPLQSWEQTVWSWEFDEGARPAVERCGLLW